VAPVTTGVVGRRWRASVTTWGAIEPWDGSPPLDWYVAADDRWHVPRHEPAVRQARVDGTPVTETRVRVPGGDVVQTVYSCADAGGVTVIEVVNESSLPVAIAFDRRNVLTERPIADVPIAGITLPAESFVMPLAHKARVRIGLAHGRAAGGALPARLPTASQVARGWVALSARASRFVLPEGEDGMSLARRLIAERCEVVLRGARDPADDPPAFVVGAGELVRLGEAAAPGLVEDVAVAAEALAADARWEADVALAAATRLLAAAGEERGVRDVERIVAGRPLSSRPLSSRPVSPPPASAPNGVFAVPWLEVQFANGTRLFPGGLRRAWLGESIEAHDVPTGASSSVSLAVRWHGARPAVLWEQSGGPVRLSSPVLSPQWESTEASGEALWPDPR
jgi:hypothetical protein